MRLLPVALIMTLAGIIPPVAEGAGGPAARWTPEQARAWMAERPWPVGCNYLPAYAVNQLEMWQADTFDPAAIDRELGWAEGLGFNSIRVFLHDLAWKQDGGAFLGRLDQFLAIAARHRISVLFVVFDGCWNPLPHPGRQPPPTPGVHNSQWVQSPGVKLLADASRHAELEAYVTALLGRFGRDRRILGWDLFNEPDNPCAKSYPATESPAKAELALRLLRETFRWARQAGPIQPLTVGVWSKEAWDPAVGTPTVAACALENSDILSFHCYDPVDRLRERIAPLRKSGRPILCTEYMARPNGSRFETVLPYLKKEGIGAFNWGFVNGRSQTVYAWNTWVRPQAGEPPEWFHDILRADGSPYRADEANFIRRLLRGIPASYGWLPDGTAVQQYTLRNSRGLACRVITYGGIITQLMVPDRQGRFADIVLGCDDLAGYLKPSPYFGAIVGRVANRIALGRFTLDGRDHVLATNDGANHLHGGRRGFDKVVWKARYREAEGGPALELTYRSADGEEGYPGNLDVRIVYQLTESNELRIDYEAKTDVATPVNLSNHTYWNLAAGGDVLGHIVTLRAARYTPVDDGLIPTGEIAPVAGTPMDFTRPKAVGRDLGRLANHPRGYDHNFVLDARDPATPAARVEDPASGRVLEVLTDQPGIQFYTGNFLDGTFTGKGGRAYPQYGALCLETQHFPDAVHRPDFPSVILRPGGVYRTATVYRFSTAP